MYSGVMRSLFPFLSWLRRYRLEDLRFDAVSGLSVALVLVPQSMANAQLAGMPAYHGLYAAMFPAVVGGLWGSSRQMVTGTVAVISLMAAAALQPLAISGPEGYIAHMALLALLVGLAQFLLGMLRLGGVVNFLSLPVISGFTNAAAVLIALSQLSKFFGVAVNSSGSQYQTFLATLDSAWYYAHWPSVLMGVLALGLMFAAKRFAPRLPAVLAAVVVTTALSWALDFEKKLTTDSAHITSKETLDLIARYNEDLEATSRIAQTIISLKQIDASDPAEALELRYKIGERQIVHDRMASRTELLRETLRRLLFVAVVQEDGSRLFYLKRAPDLPIPVPSSGLPDGGSILRPDKSGSATERPVSAAPDASSDRESAALVVRQSSLPADSFQDGRLWRILVSRGKLDPAQLRLSSGGEVVGAMPAGLPHFSMPELSFAKLLRMLPQALLIAFVGFAESISIAKRAANRKGYRIDPNQELVGQGLANVAGGLVLAGPVAGSFSSSGINLSSGARTGLSCAFAGLGALITLFFLTKPLYYLPESVLAVVVMRSTLNLINVEEFRRVWTAKWEDGCITVITFVCTLAFAPHLDYGIAVGIVLSLAGFFLRAMHPRISVLSGAKDKTLRDAKLFKLEECRHIAVIHFQGSLFFGNANLLEEHILGRLERQPELRHLHLVCSGITSIDASGEESLSMLVERAHKAGVEVSFSAVVGSVADVLERTGVLNAVGEDNIFLTPREAVCAIYSRITHDRDCATCPLASVFCRPEEVDHPTHASGGSRESIPQGKADEKRATER